MGGLVITRMDDPLRFLALYNPTGLDIDGCIIVSGATPCSPFIPIYK